MFEIETFVLGPVETNSYLFADPQSGLAAVIDPAWDGHIIRKASEIRGWTIEQIWLTHAHFDHLAGVGGLVDGLNPQPEIALHQDDMSLWSMQGGAPLFGMRIDPGPKPTVALAHHQILKLGNLQLQVRHAPGHTKGHVVFYCAAAKIVFCGDVIFRQSIGRTDLPGGSFKTLIESISTQILSLPDETRLLSGHGPETTVGEEKKFNPFLNY